MQFIKQMLFVTSLLFINTPLFALNKVVICTDTNFWYPFTYVKNQEAVGLHIDIISKALRNIGLEPIFKPTSWKECLTEAKLGIVDAVATASYQDDRSAYLNYPEGAAGDRKSPWRVSQVGYVVITAATNKDDKPNTYKFEGDFTTIPQPVRVPMHYSVIRDLEKEGLTVKAGKNSLADFKQLIKDRTGSVVDVAEVAEHFGTQPEFAEKLVIQKRPLNNKSYYLAFSKKGKVSIDEAKTIWQEIARVREDKKVMAEFLKKY